MQGVIQAIEYSKKGAPKFKVNNSWYYAGRCKVDTLHVGAEIEFESKTFGEQNNLNGLEWWKPALSGQSAPAANTAQRPSNGVSGAVSAPSPEALYLPFISNTVAHAIQAGLIKFPAELTAWVLGAKAAMSAKPEAPQGNVSSTSADEEFDDDIPF